MNKFYDEYVNIVSGLRLRYEPSIIKEIKRYKIDCAKLHNDTLALEMNDNVYPIPKKLLSFLVDECYRNGYEYAKEFSFNFIISLVEESENISKCKFDIGKLKNYKYNRLLFICLPYDLDIWRDRLSKYFSEDSILKVFRDFKDKNGANGDYVAGKIMIVCSDNVKTIKDAEEVIEHELIHMLKDIDEDEGHVSIPIELIIGNTGEYESYVVNLINRLLAFYDSWKTLCNDTEDSDNDRKKFLDGLLHTARTCESADDILKYCKDEFDKCKDNFSVIKPELNEPLLRESLYFLWAVIRWAPEELPEIKTKLYKEFLGD